MPIKKITKITDSQINKGNKLIAEFMGYVWNKNGNINYPHGCWVNNKNQHRQGKDGFQYNYDWNWLMHVVDKIERCIDTSFEIRNCHSRFCWWHSPTKKVRFSGQQNSWTEPRTPFDLIGGKYYSVCVGNGETGEKINVETKILSTWKTVIIFLEWLKEKAPQHFKQFSEDGKN